MERVIVSLPDSKNCYVYSLDRETTGMMLSGNMQLVGLVKQYLINRVRDLARRSGYKKFVIVPGYGKRDVVLCQGKV